MKEIPQIPGIIASGPLTSESLSKSVAKLSGEEHLFFFEGIAPIVHALTWLLLGLVLSSLLSVVERRANGR